MPLAIVLKGLLNSKLKLFPRLSARTIQPYGPNAARISSRTSRIPGSNSSSATLTPQTDLGSLITRLGLVQRVESLDQPARTRLRTLGLLERPRHLLLVG